MNINHLVKHRVRYYEISSVKEAKEEVLYWKYCFGEYCLEVKFSFSSCPTQATDEFQEVNLGLWSWTLHSLCAEQKWSTSQSGQQLFLPSISNWASKLVVYKCNSTRHMLVDNVLVCECVRGWIMLFCRQREVESAVHCCDELSGGCGGLFQVGVLRRGY